MAQYAAALDQGTTSTRCMIFDHGGNVAAVEQLEHEQIYPKPGWVEHDPNEIWQRTRQVMDGALGKVGGNADDIAALGVTNQRETTVVWDRNTGEPVYNAIVWQDTRTDKICDELSADEGPGPLPSEDRPAHRHLLLGAEDPLDPRERGRRARPGRCRRPHIRQHRHLEHLEPHRRHGRWPARDRPEQRQPDDADEPRDARLGRRAARRHRSPALDAAGDPALER